MQILLLFITIIIISNKRHGVYRNVQCIYIILIICPPALCPPNLNLISRSKVYRKRSEITIDNGAANLNMNLLLSCATLYNKMDSAKMRRSALFVIQMRNLILHISTSCPVAPAIDRVPVFTFVCPRINSIFPLIVNV